MAKFADGSEADISDMLCSELLAGSSSSACVEGAQAACTAAAGPTRRQKKRKKAELNHNVLFLRSTHGQLQFDPGQDSHRQEIVDLSPKD